jgi:prepilin-type N-terminal cleavage/methylation domain-containing protein
LFRAPPKFREFPEIAAFARVGIFMKDSKKGFTLIELLITIAIVGILAAIAMPMFRMHVIRARLTEAEHTMAVVKSAVSAYHHDTESWPTCPTINEVRNSLGVGLGAVERVSQISVDPNGVITATVANIDPTVDNKDLILRPMERIDGSVSWVWDWSSDFPVHLRPRS